MVEFLSMSLFFNGDPLSPCRPTSTYYPSRLNYHAIVLKGISMNYQHHNLLNEAKCAPTFFGLIWVRKSLMERV